MEKTKERRDKDARREKKERKKEEKRIGLDKVRRGTKNEESKGGKNERKKERTKPHKESKKKLNTMNELTQRTGEGRERREGLTKVIRRPRMRRGESTSLHMTDDLEKCRLNIPPLAGPEIFLPAL